MNYFKLNEFYNRQYLSYVTLHRVTYLLLFIGLTFFSCSNKNSKKMGDSNFELFKTANKLWYVEGKLDQARKIYLELNDPLKDDPIYNLQIGRTEWSFGNFQKAKNYFDTSLKYKKVLCKEGQESLTSEIKNIRNKQDFQNSLPIDISKLDIETLKRLELDQEDWWELGHACEERELYGIAAFAYQKGSEDFSDSDTEREISKMHSQASIMVNFLLELRC